MQSLSRALYLGERNPSDKGKARPAIDAKDAAAAPRMSVLLVDDVRDVSDLYALYLKHLGVAVATAEDATTALRVIAGQRPDVVVLDLAMPGMTGWDLLRTLRSDPSTQTLPVVVVSGQNARESALQAGADAYLEKPCLPDALFAELLRVLHGKRDL